MFLNLIKHLWIQMLNAHNAREMGLGYYGWREGQMGGHILTSKSITDNANTAKAIPTDLPMARLRITLGQPGLSAPCSTTSPSWLSDPLEELLVFFPDFDLPIVEVEHSEVVLSRALAK